MFCDYISKHLCLECSSHSPIWQSSKYSSKSCQTNYLLQSIFSQRPPHPGVLSVPCPCCCSSLSISPYESTRFHCLVLCIRFPVQWLAQSRQHWVVNCAGSPRAAHSSRAHTALSYTGLDLSSLNLSPVIAAESKAWRGKYTVTHSVTVASYSRVQFFFHF